VRFKEKDVERWVEKKANNGKENWRFDIRTI